MDGDIPLLILDQVRVIQERKNPHNSDVKDTLPMSFTDIKIQLPIFFGLLVILVVLIVIYYLMNTRRFLTRYGSKIDVDQLPQVWVDALLYFLQQGPHYKKILSKIFHFKVPLSTG